MKSQRGYQRLLHVFMAGVLAAGCFMASGSSWSDTVKNQTASTPASNPATKLTMVRGIDLHQEDGQLLIDVETNATPAFKSFELKAPHRIVVDLQNSEFVGHQHHYPVLKGNVRSVRLAQFSSVSPKTVRAVFTVEGKLDYKLVGEANAVRFIVSLPKEGSSEIEAAPKQPGPPRIVAEKTVPVAPAPSTAGGVINAQNRPATVVRAIEARAEGENLVVSIHSDGILRYKSFELENPRRLVVDLAGVNLRAPRRTLSLKEGDVSVVRAGQFSSGENPTVRVVMEESKKAPYQVDSSATGLNFIFPVTKQDKPAPQKIISPGKTETSPASVPVREVSLKTNTASVPVAVEAKTEAKPLARPKPASIKTPQPAPIKTPQPAPLNPPLAAKTVEPPSNWMTLPPALKPPVKPAISVTNLAELHRPNLMTELLRYDSIQPSVPTIVDTPPKPQTTVVSVTPTPQPAAAEKTVAEKSAPETAAQAKAVQESVAPPKPDALAVNQGSSAPAAPSGSAQQPPPASVSPSQAVTNALQAPTMPTSPQAPPAVNPNDIISLDLRDVDIRDFFRLIHEVSGLNVVLDPSVRGTLTIALKDVPWEQALDVVLQNNQLGKELEGNVLRITTLKSLEDEQTQRRKILEAKRAEEEAAQRQTFVRIPNYLRAQDVANVFQQLFASKYGKGNEDSVFFFGANAAQQQNKPVNNVVIVHTTPQKMADLDAILKTIDVKSEQVEIEARVVAANRTFLRDLGVQLGFQGFSNSLNNVVSGLTSMNSPVTRAPRPPVSSTAPQVTPGTVTTGPLPLNMNLGAASPTSGIGYLYSGPNALLDAFISAAEAKGTAKVLSKPKFITQNYREGMVMQGVKIPFQTVVNNTVTTQLQDAALTLRVTPQITKDGNIILDADIKNDSPDFTNLVLGQPSIQTQEITTKVMIGDGQTIVIGGVMLDRNSVNYRQVPGLGDIPVIGNLFKNKTVQNTTQELLFFLTPRVIK